MLVDPIHGELQVQKEQLYLVNYNKVVFGKLQ